MTPHAESETWRDQIYTHSAQKEGAERQGEDMEVGQYMLHWNSNGAGKFIRGTQPMGGISKTEWDKRQRTLFYYQFALWVIYYMSSIKC